MFYFLIILVPFLMVMAWLVSQNRKLKKRYEAIEQQVYEIRDMSGLQHIKFPMGINRDFVVTNNSIKRLESFLLAFEEPHQVKKRLVANTYSPKSDKLAALELRAESLKKLIEKKNAELTR